MRFEDVPLVLREGLGSEATSGLLDLLDTTRQEWAAEVTTVAIERFERRLSDEISSLGTSLRAEIRAVDSTLRLEMRDLGATLRQEMNTQRIELLKWSFLFLVGQAATTAAIVGGMLALVMR